MAPPEIVRIGMKRLRLAIASVICFVLALPMFMLVVWRFPYSDGFGLADAIAMFGVAFFGWITAFGTGISLRNPVGLRLDMHGLSGFELSQPLAWSDVADVDSVRTGRAYAVALLLKHPESYLPCLKWWQRLSMFGKVKGAQALVPTSRLNLPHDQILQQVRDFHHRYG